MSPFSSCHAHLPDSCDTVEGIVRYAIYRGLFVAPRRKGTNQVRAFANYLSSALNDNIQRKKYATINAKTVICYIQKMLGKHFPGDSLIRFNANVAMSVTLMSLTRREIPLESVEGLFWRRDHHAIEATAEFLEVQREFGFAWPPIHIETIDLGASHGANDGPELAALCKAVKASAKVAVVRESPAETPADEGAAAAPAEEAAGAPVEEAAAAPVRTYAAAYIAMGSAESAFEPYSKRARLSEPTIAKTDCPCPGYVILPADVFQRLMGSFREV